MTDATWKGQPNEVQRSKVKEQAFQNLKKRICEKPILRLPDVSQPFMLQTDASHIVIGAALL